MRNPSPLSYGIRLPFHYRRLNRNRSVKLVSRCCSSRHLLRSGPFPLRTFNGGCICHLRRIYPLISSIYGTNPSSSLNEVPFLNHVCRREPNIFPSTFPWVSRNATTILRLPGRLYYMKCPVISGVNRFTCLCGNFCSNFMGSIRQPTPYTPASLYSSLCRMTP